MANSKQLQQNKAQHMPKNVHSKKSDKRIYGAMKECITYLEQRLQPYLGNDYELSFDKHISYEDMIRIISQAGCRRDFDRIFSKRTIKPDGGVIFLKKKSDPEYLKMVLISEVKKQGTNKERMEAGQKKQAQGNAIERLGKNLIGIRATLNHEPVTPFVCFGWGCDFEEEYSEDDFVMSKITMMNEFYQLNKTYVFKKDGSSDKNFYSPVSMYFREEEWTKDEMLDILKEIGETSLRYYIF